MAWNPAHLGRCASSAYGATNNRRPQDALGGGGGAMSGGRARLKPLHRTKAAEGGGDEGAGETKASTQGQSGGVAWRWTGAGEAKASTQDQGGGVAGRWAAGETKASTQGQGGGGGEGMGGVSDAVEG